MRVVVQRVSRAAVTVDHEIIGEIERGLLLLIGVEKEDTHEAMIYTMDKCVNLRIFEDENGKMNRSVKEIDGEILAISQFTLYGNTRKGRRPSFVQAAAPDVAEPMYNLAVQHLKHHDLKVSTGQFGAHMQVDLLNDGPVTLIVESK